jgi:hypothetical protein
MSVPYIFISAWGAKGAKFTETIMQKKIINTPRPKLGIKIPIFKFFMRCPCFGNMQKKLVFEKHNLS